MFAGQSVCFQALSLKNQLFLWIGLESELVFKELSMAIGTLYEKSPTPVKLMGNMSSMISSNLASRLSKKMNKPVFVSFNIPEDNQELLAKIEEKLLEEINVAPHLF